MSAVALSYGEDDLSNNRERAKRGDFVELFDVDATKAHALMQSADLDVVVDLMTHTRGARLELASESVAPSGSALMVSYLGYPGVAGGVHWDYTLADSYCVAAGTCKRYRRAADLPPVLLPGERLRSIISSYSRRRFSTSEVYKVLQHQPGR